MLLLGDRLQARVETIELPFRDEERRLERASFAGLLDENIDGRRGELADESVGVAFAMLRNAGGNQLAQPQSLVVAGVPRTTRAFSQTPDLAIGRDDLAQ